MTSDRFSCASLKTLFNWINDIDEKNELFGIPSELFFTPLGSDPFRFSRYGQMLETPIGAAAGPHTQLSQNIISAWLTGARYMELKTVQILDELNVTKPCIDMSDEGYNCEWSQELKLDKSFDEYLNAWILIHVLKDKLGFDTTARGFIFNMSVGYNLEGIMSSAVQKFLDRMQDCRDLLDSKIHEISAYYPRIKDIEISPSISCGVTVSTMHGCPPEEIEKIGRYFIEQRKIDTTIKLNPTLLGADALREILNRNLGYDITVPDIAFEHDLKYEAGIALIKSLQESAKRSKAAFNLKLTNTLETSNILQNLPKNEQMVYMSGRALHPISINTAAKLQREFDGQLDISFSAGADCFNISDIIRCGMRPVTVCSDILKPGGYGRLRQYIDILRTDMERAGASSMDEFAPNPLEYLMQYAEKTVSDPRYAKASRPYASVKTNSPLGFFDCAQAPCITGCPAGQEIPRYLEYTASGELENAYRTITATNPFPNVQGRVCDHLCQSKCTRINYEKPLLIREIKRYVSERFSTPPAGIIAKNGIKVAVIGAGPAGLSCANFLALEGFDVEIIEAKGFAGGMAADGIPIFRLDDGSLKKDIDRILSLGVKLRLNTKVTPEIFAELRDRNDYIYIAVGAQKSMPLNISGIDAKGVFSQLDYLSKIRRGEEFAYGQNIIIIGAGNSAMDAARTARRISPHGSVTIVYRRTRREMPCDPEEVRGAIEEGIQITELASPVSVQTADGRVTGLVVQKMRLGEAGTDGRRKPEPIPDSHFTIPADTIIPAIGQEVVLDFFPSQQMQVNPKSYETNLRNVFAGGDAYRGASSLIHAIGDGQKAALAIMKKSGIEFSGFRTPADRRNPDFRKLQIMQAQRDHGIQTPEKAPADRINFNLFTDSLSDEDAVKEASRCLQCDLICNICTTVCPNRSNMYYKAGRVTLPTQEAYVRNSICEIVQTGEKFIKDEFQIINIGDFCNECGNCTTFCPSAGEPYKDKPKFHITKESYVNAVHGFHIIPSGMLIKTAGGEAKLIEKDGMYHYENAEISVVFDSGLKAHIARINKEHSEGMDISFIAEYIVLYKNIRQNAPFNYTEVTQ
jgi:putative selenate reductase